MRSLWFMLVGVVMGLVVGSPSRAGPIVVWVGATQWPQTYESGEDITIDVGHVDSVTLVRIFDSTLGAGGLPDDDIGHVTIEGSADVESGVELRVLIGSGAVAAFPEFALDPVDPGCRSFRGRNPDGTPRPAGITIRNPSNALDRSLLKVSRLAMSAVDEITGDIEVAKVFRVQAGASSANPSDLIGGHVSANITAIGRDLFPDGFRTIEQVRAGHGITGAIIATGEEAYFHTDVDGGFKQASINVILVGPGQLDPQDPTTGIKGDIRADFGEIVQIWTTGQIGLPDDPNDPNDEFPLIQAWRNIQQIRTIAEHGPMGMVPGELREIDIFAHIVANKGFEGPLGITPSSINDGELQLIEAGGDLTGSIRMNAITANTRNTLGRSGILVRGKIDAPIHVRIDVQNGDIVGERILQPIYVGNQLKGSVVAYGESTPADPDAGRIESLRVGDRFDVPAIFANSRQAGFAGNNCPPMNLYVDPPGSINPWLDRAASGAGCPDGGTFDSTIYADRIIDLWLERVTQNWKLDDVKFYKPRIEARRIDSAYIGMLESGVIWSGRLEYDSTGQVANDDLNDYASIGALEIGCVGPTADVWFKDCELARFRNVSGELHLPKLSRARRFASPTALTTILPSVVVRTTREGRPDCLA